MNRRDDSFYSNDEDEFDSRHLREPAAKSMSTGSKVLLIVGGIFGVLMLLCCGGAVWFVSKIEEPRATSNPTEIAEIKNSILEFEVSERFDPVQAMTMDLVMMKMETVSYEARDGESMLMLMGMNMPVQEAQMDDVRRSMQMQAGGQTHLENFKSESKTYTVDGMEVSAVYSHGTQPRMQGVPADRAGAEWFTAQIVLAPDKNVIMITINGPEEEFDFEEIETMIQSIKRPK
ncbi:MAG TPA: hypothetical protein VMM56_10140 [Planctomycetaceae bacterium]|nr:hypothetical protein [Planctomycetaceae bacterium]